MSFGLSLRLQEGSLSQPRHGSRTRIPAGEGLDTGHGDRLDTVVHRIGEHPIHTGLPRA